LVTLSLLGLSACGGAAPLLHPAHALPEGDVTMGAGFSGTAPVGAKRLEVDQTAERSIEEGAFSAGLAPWVGGRYGFGDGWEAGLTYTGRSIRVDGRHAFDIDGAALSLGLGASGVLPRERDDLGLSIGGFGGDVPILFGLISDSDVYAGWIGVRGGIELLRGSRTVQPDAMDPTLLSEEVSGWHAQAGGLLGFRVGFRYIYAAMELSAAMHWAEGSVGASDVMLRQFALAPSGALIVRF
jgi:hypothetical protein